MTDVLIHRCTLRVARRGGWSWGPDPKRMLQEVVACFPALLARKLEQLFPKAEDREFSAPMQIRIPIRMSDLLSATGSPAPLDTSGEPRATASLEEKLDLALRRTFPIERSIETGATRSDGFGISSETSSAENPAGQRCNAGAVPRLLAQWHESGLLESRLAALSNDEIEGWHRAVWRRCVDSDELAPEPDSMIEQQIRDSVKVDQIAFVGDDHGTRLRLRLLIATRVAAKIRIPLESPPLLAALNRILPVAEPSAASAPIGVPGADPRAPQANPPREHFQSEARRQSPREWEVHVACALPFLLSGPLSRLGYFDAVAAVLDAADLADQAPLFAAALAYKILDPPERGWRRTPASLQAASAFAGLHEHAEVANESLVEFSRQIALHTAPLDWLLTDSLIRGHTPGEPLLLRRADMEDSTGFLLIEVDGCFPIAWTEDVPQLLPILGKLGSSIILVSREAAGPRVLRELDAAGLCFITDVPPTRGESWRRIQQGPLPVGWTNHPAPESVPVLQAARDFTAVSEDAAALWETLAVARPSVIHARLPHLDRSLTLAAAVAGGMIAWKLWRKRGRTSPQMVVERFCDLDGRISFDRNSVVVRLPLGRRHQELSDNGLLSPVRDIPWLEGRRVEFGGG
jgi:hypothetical protein